MRPPSPTNGLIVVLLVVLVGLQVVQYRASERFGQRLSQLELAHRQLQDTYLDGSQARRAQLAAEQGYRRIPIQTQAPELRAGMLPSAISASAADGRTPTATQIEQSLREDRAQAERAFASEPVNPSWAGNVRQNVDDLLQQSTLQGHALNNVTIDCRSRTCRIQFNANTGEDTDGLLQDLLSNLAADLPTTRILQRASPDGSGTEFSIYASAR